jgi:uncharacterized membrane protein
MRPSWLVIALVASLVLNVFLVGAGAGVFTLAMRMAHDSAGPRPGAFQIASRDLPPADRQAMREMLRGAWADVRTAADQSRRLRAEAWGALADPKPDPAAIKQQLAQSRQLDLTARTAVEEKVVDYVAARSPADRTIVVAGLRSVFPPPPGTGPPPPANQAAAAKP